MATSPTKKNKLEDVGINNQDLRVVQLESMRGCKAPAHRLGGLLPSGALRAPDRKQLRLYIKPKIQQMIKTFGEDNFSPCPKLHFGQSLGGY